MQSHAPIIVALHKAREVAKELGVGAMVPADVQPHHIHEVEVVFGLLKHGTHTFSTPHAEMTAISEQSRVDDDSVVLTPKVAEYSTVHTGRDDDVASVPQARE